MRTIASKDPKMTPSRIGKSVMLASIIATTTASGALVHYVWLQRPPHRIERPQPSYAGDCGPNPPPGYRWDSKGWRTGFSRDFYCYMLDEY